jgi:tetratricopeptide (TPR) repeat protein
MGDGDRDGSGQDSIRIPLVQREVVLLVAICILAVVLFFGTRRLAAWSRTIKSQAAAASFAAGQEAVARGDVEGAVTAFQRAASGDRTSLTYQLALARTLTTAGRREAAEQILLSQREAHPDDIDINYRLAEIARVDGRPADAIRYYNHALYGLDVSGSSLNRHDIRTELITLLLVNGDRDAARDELNALTREVPDTAGAHLDAARLARRIPDDAVALREFLRAADLDPADATAPAAGGAIALALGDFVTAERALQKARDRGDTSESVAHALTVAHTAQRSDPLAAGIAASERGRRLLAGITWALGRITACPAAADSPAASDTAGLRTELEAVQHGKPADLVETDALLDGVRLIARAEDTVGPQCHAPDTRGEAWLAIARAHADAHP